MKVILHQWHFSHTIWEKKTPFFAIFAGWVFFFWKQSLSKHYKNTAFYKLPVEELSQLNTCTWRTGDKKDKTVKQIIKLNSQDPSQSWWFLSPDSTFSAELIFSIPELKSIQQSFQHLSLFRVKCLHTNNSPFFFTIVLSLGLHMYYKRKKK